MTAVFPAALLYLIPLERAGLALASFMLILFVGARHLQSVSCLGGFCSEELVTVLPGGEQQLPLRQPRGVLPRRVQPHRRLLLFRGAPLPNLKQCLTMFYRVSRHYGIIV